jgi:arylesterase/paraoxonase
MSLSWLVRSASLVLAIGAAATAATLYSFGHFDGVDDRFDGDCASVTGVAGPEDLQPARDRIYVASLDRTGRAARGAILAVSPEDPLDSSGWRDRTGGVPADFRPAGLYYFDNGAVRRVFVVNEAGPSIELYDVEENGDLTHVETFRERRLTSPNDIVATGPRSFYVSNDVEAGRTTAIGALQFLTRAPAGKVYYFDGIAFRIAAEGLRFPNGLAIAENDKVLHVAETSGYALKTFTRDSETGALTLARTTPMPAAPDNINIAFDGSLWIGAHPKPLAVGAVHYGAADRAPSSVIRYDSKDAKKTYAEIFSDSGERISGASVAALDRGRLIIGSLFDDKYLICEFRK